jgi:hypothetical protein
MERDMVFLPEQAPEDMEMLWGLEYMQSQESKYGSNVKYVHRRISSEKK